MSSPIKVFHKRIPALLLSVMSKGGRTIRQIEYERGRPLPNSAPDALFSGSEPVWHSRADILERLGDAMQIGPKYRGPRRVSNDFYNAVDQEISKLRRKGHLADWSNEARAGVFCLLSEHRVHENVITPVLISDNDHGLRSTSSDGASLSALQEGTGHGTYDDNNNDHLKRSFLTILSRGRKDNTYKFALARALLEYCRNIPIDNDNIYTVPYSYLADKFLEYYWHQECKFKIKQDYKTKSTPKVITAIRETFPTYTRGKFKDVDEQQRAKATDKIQRGVFGSARSKTSLVVPRFQRIVIEGYAEERNVFYDYDDDLQQLTLRPEAFSFFRSNHALLYRVVLVEWAKFLERINGSLPRLIAKIEQEKNARRLPLTKFKKEFEPYMCHCFYCRSRLDHIDVHADHLIPWSYIFEDEAWNLVLACSRCNLKKSDSLPQREYLDDLLRRNSKYQRRIRILNHSLRTIDTKMGWQKEIQNHYEICQEYGFGMAEMP